MKIELRSPEEATHVLHLRQNISATPEEAYDAFTQPEHLSRWFTTNAEADLRPGGRYTNGDGDVGEFLVLAPPKRLDFSWENANHCPGSIVSITFAPDEEGGTEITLEHSRLTSEVEVDGMNEGWSWALDSLKSYLETGKPISHEDWVKARNEEGFPE